MTAVWLIGIVAAINFAIKASGPVLLAGRELPDGLLRIIALLAPAILTARPRRLDQRGRRLKVDAQTAGVAVAGVAMGLRVSMLAAIALGVTTAAALRGFL